ncbi:hypothetical protein ACFFRR_000511 [Megaselia abdita]
MDFKQHPLFYEHVVKILCEKLCLTEIKSLSLVSKEWFHATSPMIGEKCTISPEQLQKCQRKYKSHKVCSYGELQRLVEWFKVVKKSNRGGRVFYLSSLTVKDIVVNESVLQFIRELENLHTLTLEDCDFSANNKKLPSFSVHLKDLRIIDYRDENKSPEKVRRKIIRTIWKENSTITDVSLVVYDFAIYESLLVDPNLLPNLESLDMSVYAPETNKIYDQILQIHSNLKSIVILVDFDDSKMQFLQESCKRIQTISKIETDNIKASTLRKLQCFENLQSLNMSVRNIRTIKKLAGIFLPQLRSLNFDAFGIRVHEVCLRGILFAVPNLTSIDLRCDFNGLKGNIFSILANSLPHLMSLVLVRLVITPDFDIPVEKAKFPKLTLFHMYYSEVMGSVLSEVQAPQLKDFYAYRTEGKALVHFIKECQFLETFYLASAVDLTDEMVMYAFQNGKFLKYLHLEETKNLSTRVIEAFLASFVNMAILKVENLQDDDDIFKKAESNGFSLKRNESGGCYVLTNGYRKIDIVLFRNVLNFGNFKGSLSFEKGDVVL